MTTGAGLYLSPTEKDPYRQNAVTRQIIENIAVTPGHIGIGTPNPGGQLEISNSGDSSNWGITGGAGLFISGTLDNSANFYTMAIGSDAQTLVEWLWYRTRGTQGAPTPLQNGDTIGQWQVAGRNSANGTFFESFALGGNITATCVGDWTSTSSGMQYNFATTNSGSTIPVVGMRLNDSGGLSIGSSTVDPGAGNLGFSSTKGISWHNDSVTIKENGLDSLIFAGAGAGYVFDTSIYQVSGGVTSGGNTNAAIYLSQNFMGIYFGSGAPTISAAQGSIYLRSDGTSTTRMYINTNGSTGWTTVTTAG